MRVFVDMPGDNSCSNAGEVRVTVMQRPNYKVGRISLCEDGEWRAVCDQEWGIQEARVVCRQLGLPEQGMYAAWQTLTLSCNAMCYSTQGPSSALVHVLAEVTAKE